MREKLFAKSFSLILSLQKLHGLKLKQKPQISAAFIIYKLNFIKIRDMCVDFYTLDCRKCMRSRRAGASER